MRRFIVALGTDKFGAPDEIPLLAIVIIIALIVFQGYDLFVRHNPFDAFSFCSAAGILLFGSSAGTGMRDGIFRNPVYQPQSFDPALGGNMPGNFVPPGGLPGTMPNICPVPGAPP